MIKFFFIGGLFLLIFLVLFHLFCYSVSKALRKEKEAREAAEKKAEDSRDYSWGKNPFLK